MNKQKICIAPLDWGLGHATRCIQLAKALMQLDYQVYIASEGYHEVILREALPSATFLPFNASFSNPYILAYSLMT